MIENIFKKNASSLKDYYYFSALKLTHYIF